MTSFNYGDYILRALASVRAQTFPAWELVVVDDGSTDSSRRICQGFADKNPQLDISLLFTRNGGVSRARNLGIAVARGRYVSCLDADDYLAPTALAKLYDVFEKDPQVDVVRPFLQCFGASSQVWDFAGRDFTTSASANPAPYCSMFTRKAWQRVGGYDETMPAHEDWDFWFSLGEIGCRMATVPELLHHYRTSRDGLSSRNSHRDLELRARIVIRHPAAYNEATREFAEKVLAGEDVDEELAAKPPHRIFSLSDRARALRGEETSVR